VGLHLTAKLDRASQFYFRGVIIENTFTSISEMADHVFPFFKWMQNVKARMIRLKWDSINQVGDIKTPMFYISGDEDTFVPTEMTHRLFDATDKALFKEKWIIPGGNHNNTFIVAGPDYVLRLKAFLQKCHELPIEISSREASSDEEPLEATEEESTGDVKKEQ